jgi:hypothetical protein
MKKNLAKIILISLFTFVGYVLMAQGGPPPPPGDPHGGNDDFPMGGGAPIGNGIGILLTLGAAYGSRKIYKFFKDREALEE